MLIPRMIAAVFVAVLVSQPRPAFDLDVPRGDFDSWAITDVGPVAGAEIEFEIRDVRHDPKWRAAYVFEVNDGVSDPKLLQFAGVQFTDAGGSGLKAFLITGRGDTPTRRTDLGFSIQPRTRLPMTLDWSAERDLKVSAAGHVVETPLDFNPKGFQVAVSTGRLTGHSLKLLGAARR
jgi:hypothetical protein